MDKTPKCYILNAVSVVLPVWTVSCSITLLHCRSEKTSPHIFGLTFTRTVSHWSLSIAWTKILVWTCICHGAQLPPSAPQICLPRALEYNINQPCLGSPELFWESGLDPSLSISSLVFRERNCTMNRHLCAQNLPAPWTTTSSCACLNSTHFLPLLQICTSFTADLELRKTEHRLGAKFYLKKQRQNKNNEFFSAICFQPPIFSSNCNSSISVLFIYWYSCRKSKEWTSCLPVCFPRKCSIAFAACRPLFFWGAAMGRTHLYSRYISLRLGPMSEKFVFSMCVFVCASEKGSSTIPHCPPN